MHVPGAQTERRGGYRPVRSLLGGKTSPAAFTFNQAVELLITTAACRPVA